VAESAFAPVVNTGARHAQVQSYTVGHDGHFTASEIIEAEDDKRAIRIAEKLVDGHDVELWIWTGKSKC
jgi:hypothetical protein